MRTNRNLPNGYASSTSSPAAFQTWKAVVGADSSCANCAMNAQRNPSKPPPGNYFRRPSRSAEDQTPKTRSRGGRPTATTYPDDPTNGRGFTGVRGNRRGEPCSLCPLVALGDCCQCQGNNGFRSPMERTEVTTSDFEETDLFCVVESRESPKFCSNDNCLGPRDPAASAPDLLTLEPRVELSARDLMNDELVYLCSEHCRGRIIADARPTTVPRI